MPVSIVKNKDTHPNNTKAPPTKNDPDININFNPISGTYTINI